MQLIWDLVFLTEPYVGQYHTWVIETHKFICTVHKQTKQPVRKKKYTALVNSYSLIRGYHLCKCQRHVWAQNVYIVYYWCYTPSVFFIWDNTSSNTNDSTMTAYSALKWLLYKGMQTMAHLDSGIMICVPNNSNVGEMQNQTPRWLYHSHILKSATALLHYIQDAFHKPHCGQAIGLNMN